MPSATSTADRRHRTVSWAATGLAAVLAGRRALDLYHLARCPAPPPRSDTHAGGEIHVILPLYHEQLLADSLVAFWAKLVDDDPALTVLLVTTDKEGRGPDTTSALLDAAQQRAPWPAGLQYLHVDTTHPYRAVQINTALESIRQAAGQPAEGIWVGIYNADSRPDPGTFDELRHRIDEAPQQRAYQQLAQYVRPPADRPSPPVMESFADHQTWWTYSRWAARVRRSHSRRRLWAATAPFSTFGHGEFFRLDLLDEIGGIPDWAYADGLLVGWLIRFGGEPLGLLASPDWAEVPRQVTDVVGQHRAWMLGLLNVGDAAAHAKALGNHDLSRPARRLLLASHRAIPVMWGLRPLAAAGAVAWAAVQPRSRASWTALAALIGYAAVPQVAGGLARSKAPPHPDGPYRPAPLRTRWHGIPAALLVDGLGFWPAVVDKARSAGEPPKTPR